MIVNFEFDDATLVDAVISSAKDAWKDDVCERVAENIDASDIAECVSTYDIAREIDMDDVFSNVEMDYEQLSELIIDAQNFKYEIAALMWQEFSEEFGTSMKCVREEIALMNVDIERFNLPFWRRWFNLADKKEAAAS